MRMFGTYLVFEQLVSIMYVHNDLLTLADVFENFRKICRQNYDSDSVQLLTMAGLAWQAFLNMTPQPLELFTNVDKYLFIERGIYDSASCQNLFIPL